MANNDSWFNDATFWENAYEYMFPQKRMEAADREVESILALAGEVKGPGLDLACGPGRHSIAFAQRGLDVTGVDLTPFLLSKARERAKAEEVEVEWIESDMREFIRPETYDLAISLFTSFGYFEEHEENMSVLRNIHRNLLPGGRFILDLAGKEILARIYQPSYSFDLTGGLMVHRRTLSDDWSRMNNEWIWIENDVVTHRYMLRHWIYSAREIIWMMGEAGFAEVDVYGDMQGGPYDQDAARLLAIGRKKM